MRALGRIILLVGITALFIFYEGGVNPSSLWPVGQPVDTPMPLEQLERSLSYAPRPGHWLEFEVGSQRGQVKIISNADIVDPVKLNIDQSWNYTIEYQLMGRDDQVLEAGEYYHRTRVTLHERPDGEPLPGQFYLGSERIPADGRRILLQTAKGNPTRLRVRLAETGPGVDGVAIRVYRRRDRTVQQWTALWRKLTEQERRHLARSVVYGPPFLTDQEKANLVRNRWKAVAPKGIEGVAYESQVVYTPSQELGQAVRESAPIPVGLYADSMLRAVVPVTRPQRLRLVFTRAGSADGTAPAPVDMTWHGRGIARQATYAVRLDAEGGDYSGRFEPGLLEISSPVPVTVRVFHLDEGKSIETTPEPFLLRGFSGPGDQPVTYRVASMNGQHKPFRLDARLVLGREPGPRPIQGRLTYEWLGAEGRLLRRGRLDVSAPVSQYDAIFQENEVLRVSDPQSAYFSLPPAVERVRVHTPAHVSVSAYTRIPGSERVLSLPGDYQPDYDDPDRIPGWFPLMPVNRWALRRAGLSRLLHIQYQPVERASEILAGRFHWEGFEPVGDWLGRYLLTRRSPGAPWREEALGATFTAIQADTPVTLTLITPTGQETVEPTLLFLREDATPGKVSITIDEQTPRQRTFSGTRGRISLPALKPGKHRLRIESSTDARWYINHAGPRQPAHTLRMSQRLDNAALVYSIDKRSDGVEIISGNFYGDPQGERAVVRVTVASLDRGPGPFIDWTFRQRLFRFDLRELDDSHNVSVFDLPRGRATEGIPFFVPLGSDLPAGRYRITVERVEGAAGYVTLSRIEPGENPAAELFEELRANAIE